MGHVILTKTMNIFQAAKLNEDLFEKWDELEKEIAPIRTKLMFEYGCVFEDMPVELQEKWNSLREQQKEIDTQVRDRVIAAGGLELIGTIPDGH